MEGWQIALVVVGTIYLGVWLLIYFNTRHEVDPRQLVALAALLPLVGLVTLMVAIVRAANSASKEGATTQLEGQGWLSFMTEDQRIRAIAASEAYKAIGEEKREQARLAEIERLNRIFSWHGR